MNKKHVLALAITLILGIIVGVSATGVANALPTGIPLLGGSHMGAGSMVDHHSSDMPEECADDDFNHGEHHSRMH